MIVHPHLGLRLFIAHLPERPILRPSDPDVQKEIYSGKETTQFKIWLLVIWLAIFYISSKRWSGKCTTKRCMKLKSLSYLKKFDFGLILALKHSILTMPKSIVLKRIQMEESWQMLKNYNQQISNIRVKVEHTIENCKVYSIVKEQI